MPTVPWRVRSAVEPGAEYLVMASYLPLRSIMKVPWFMGLTVSVVRQLERTDGLVGYSLRAQPLARSFWTLSAWTDARALAAFVRELPHQGVMAKLRPHMGPTRFTTWTIRIDASGAMGHGDRAPAELVGAQPRDRPRTPTS